MRLPSRLRDITSFAPKVAWDHIRLGQGVVSKRSAESITTTVTQPAVPQLEYRLGHDGSATRPALFSRVRWLRCAVQCCWQLHRTDEGAGTTCYSRAQNRIVHPLLFFGCPAAVANDVFVKFGARNHELAALPRAADLVERLKAESNVCCRLLCDDAVKGWIGDDAVICSGSSSDGCRLEEDRVIMVQTSSKS